MVWVTPRFSLGGTGGNAPSESGSDKLRLGLVSWLGLRLGADTDLSLQLEVGVSPEFKPSRIVKQMDSWESRLGGGGTGSGVEQEKWIGVVLRRLKTVLGLGTGFTTVFGVLLLLASAEPTEFVSMAARFGAELFRKASKLTGRPS